MHMRILDAYNYIERYQRLARYLSEAIKLSEMGIMCSDGTGKVLLSVAIAMATTIPKQWPCVMSPSLHLCAFWYQTGANWFLRCCMCGVSAAIVPGDPSNIIFLKFSPFLATTTITTVTPIPYIEMCNYSLWNSSSKLSSFSTLSLVFRLSPSSVHEHVHVCVCLMIKGETFNNTSLYSLCVCT